MLLLFLLLSAFAALALSQTSAPPSAADFDTAATRTRMSKLANETSIGGLQPWANFGKAIRLSAVAGFLPADLNEQSIIQWIAGAIAMLAICFLFAFITLIVWPCFYCCRSCGNCGGTKPKREGYTPKQRNCAMITMAVGFVLVTVGFIMGLVANSILNDGVGDVAFAVEETFSEVAAIPNNIYASTEDIIQELNTTIHNVFEIIRAAPATIVGSHGALLQFAGNTSILLTNIQFTFDDMLDQGVEVNFYVGAIENGFESLSIAMNGIETQIQDLSDPGVADGTPYTVDSNLLFVSPLPPLIVLNITGFFPNFTSLLSSIQGVNLTSTGQTVNNTFYTINSNITSLVDNEISDVENTTNSFVSLAQSDITNYINGTAGNIFSTVDNYRNQLIDDVNLYVTPNNNWRNIIMAVLFSFNIVALIFALIGFFLKRSPIMTCSAMFMFLFITLFWILCALHLIVATPFGKICDIYEKHEIYEAIQPFLEGNSSVGLKKRFLAAETGSTSSGGSSGGGSLSSLEGMSTEDDINLFYSGLTYCHNGGNLISFLNLTSEVDLQSYVNQFTNSYNLTSLVDNINVTGLVGNVDFTSGLNLTQLAQYLTYLNTDYSVYVNIVENLAYDPLVGAINNLTLILDTTAGNLPALELAVNTTGNRTLAAEDLASRIYQVNTNLLSINSSIIVWVGANMTLLRSQLSNFSTAAQNMVALVPNVTNFINGISGEITSIANSFKSLVLTRTIPESLDLINNLAANATSIIIGATDCEFLANDILGTINSVCINTVGGLDALWMTCGYLGLVLFVAIIGLTLVAKRWIRADTMDQEYGEDYYDNDNIELPPYSEGKA